MLIEDDICLVSVGKAFICNLVNLSTVMETQCPFYAFYVLMLKRVLGCNKR